VNQKHKYAGWIHDLVHCGRSVNLQVSGDSMKPILEEGDQIRIEPIKPHQARRGDILTYQYETKLVTHLLCYSLGLGHRKLMFFRGWANNFFDYPVKQNQVVGKAVAIKRDGKWAAISNYQNWLKHESNWITIRRILKSLIHQYKSVSSIRQKIRGVLQ
jgi:signal peptidase I